MVFMTLYLLTLSADFDGEDQQSLADKHRRVSFNMFAAGAQKEKSKFHKGVATAGHRRKARYDYLCVIDIHLLCFCRGLAWQ